MTRSLFIIGVVAAGGLLSLLTITIWMPRFRLWPTPGPGSWQGFIFWPLFRTLNVLCFAVALGDRAGWHGLAWQVRLAAFGMLVMSVVLFLYALRVLGRGNSYCAVDGLVTGGIYRWSRNPQNAMLIVVYGCLAFAADGARAYVLCAAMIAVYALMVLAEEPWLDAAYGASYRRYCNRVPRFFNWRRAQLLMHVMFRQLFRRKALRSMATQARWHMH